MKMLTTQHPRETTHTRLHLRAWTTTSTNLSQALRNEADKTTVHGSSSTVGQGFQPRSQPLKRYESMHHLSIEEGTNVYLSPGTDTRKLQNRQSEIRYTTIQLLPLN